MASEFERRFDQLNLDEITLKKVKQLIFEAGKEFPCLNCPSNTECENFKWYLKWYRNK